MSDNRRNGCHLAAVSKALSRVDYVLITMVNCEIRHMIYVENVSNTHTETPWIIHQISNLHLRSSSSPNLEARFPPLGSI